MASPQFLHLLEQLHKTAQTKKLAWQPTKTYNEHTNAFRVALGDGIVRIEAEGENDPHCGTSYRAALLTRDGHLVDEAYVMEYTADVEMLRDIFRTARAAAFNLDRMIDGMQDDLEAGRSRELPPEKDWLSALPLISDSDDDSIPF